MKHAPLTLKAMKQKKYLKLYERWMRAGILPHQGLCFSLPHSKRRLILFIPDFEAANLEDNISYWGYDGEYRHYDNDYRYECASNVWYEFTPLRQNIVLLMAAMNNEL